MVLTVPVPVHFDFQSEIIIFFVKSDFTKAV